MRVFLGALGRLGDAHEVQHFHGALLEALDHGFHFPEQSFMALRHGCQGLQPIHHSGQSLIQGFDSSLQPGLILQCRITHAARTLRSFTHVLRRR